MSNGLTMSLAFSHLVDTIATPLQRFLWAIQDSNSSTVIDHGLTDAEEVRSIPKD